MITLHFRKVQCNLFSKPSLPQATIWAAKIYFIDLYWVRLPDFLYCWSLKNESLKKPRPAMRPTSKTSTLPPAIVFTFLAKVLLYFTTCRSRVKRQIACWNILCALNSRASTRHACRSQFFSWSLWAFVNFFKVRTTSVYISAVPKLTESL